MSQEQNSRKSSFLRSFLHWFAPAQVDGKKSEPETSDKLDMGRVIPFALIHLMCLGVIWVGFSWVAFAVFAFFYALKVFVLTGFYHRYFSHRAFKTSRPVQFIFGFLGCMAIQRGPLWWAAHHRHHHAHSDDEEDLHSPLQHGFWWSHFGWFLTPKAFATNWDRLPDFKKFPELRWLERFDLLPPILCGIALFFFGSYLETAHPSLGTSGMQMLIWGLFCSTVAVWHVTYMVNSLAHVLGSRRYKTKDTSRNNLFISLLTFGEGWHNNHHHYPASASQGFFWWEIDISFYILVFMSKIGLVWDLKKVPQKVLYKGWESPAIPEEVARSMVRE